jgi:hypothetical protein
MYQSGLITLQDLDGIEMDKYAVEPFTAAVGKICRREGFGEWFAEGLGKAAQKIAGGKGFKTLDWVIQSRNRPSFSMHDLAYRGFAETGKASVTARATSSRIPTRSTITATLKFTRRRQANPLRKPNG